MADLEYYDLVYVMDRSNLRDVSEVAGTEAELEKIFLIMSLVDDALPEDVPDPYYDAGGQGFETVYKMLDMATDKLIEKYSTV